MRFSLLASFRRQADVKVVIPAYSLSSLGLLACLVEFVPYGAANVNNLGIGLESVPAPAQLLSD